MLLEWDAEYWLRYWSVDSVKYLLHWLHHLADDGLLNNQWLGRLLQKHRLCLLLHEDRLLLLLQEDGLLLGQLNLNLLRLLLLDCHVSDGRRCRGCR